MAHACPTAITRPNHRFFSHSIAHILCEESYFEYTYIDLMLTWMASATIGENA